MSLCFGAPNIQLQEFPNTWVPAQLRAKSAAGALLYSAEAQDMSEGQRSQVVVSNQPLA